MKDLFDVFSRFFLLGLMSFGGPAAHIAYFRKQFVEQLKWLDDATYARLVALSQFLPGPGSSQVGFALGYRRAGLAGAIAAFIAFTTPSFILLWLLSVNPWFGSDHEIMQGVIQGLKLLAVVVVSDAVLSMFKSFCKNKLTICVAIFTAAALILMSSLTTQLICLLIAAAVGALQGRQATQAKKNVNVSWLPLLIFLLLFLGLPALLVTGVSQNTWLVLFNQFYQAGSLVFGGGHVVLPLLQQTLGDAISNDQFLMGYAAAQAVPGPMFTMATFLGAEMRPDSPLIAALLTTLAIFLPGFLLVLALQNSWEALATRAKVAGAIAGINAAVVGLLMAALYQPVFTAAVTGWLEFAVVVLGFAALRFIKIHIGLLVFIFAVLGLFV